MTHRPLLRSGSATFLRHAEAEKSDGGYEEDLKRRTTQNGCIQIEAQFARITLVIPHVRFSHAFAGRSVRAQEVAQSISKRKAKVIDALTPDDTRTPQGYRLDRVYQGLVGTDSFHDYASKEYDLVMTWIERAYGGLCDSVDSDIEQNIVVGMNGGCYLGGILIKAVGGESAPYAAALIEQRWHYVTGATVFYADYQPAGMLLHL